MNPSETLPARMWHSLRLEVILMYDGRVPWPGSDRAVCTSNYVLWLIRKGGVTLTDESGGEMTHGPDTWLLLSPGYTRHQVFADDSEMLSMHLTAKWPDGRDLFASHSPLIRHRTCWPDLERAAGRLVPRGEQYSLDNPLEAARFVDFEAARFSMIGEWIRAVRGEGVVLRVPRQLDERVQRVLEELDRMEYTGRLPYDRLSRRCGLSRTQIDRLFQASLGRTPHRYLEERCCERIRKQLLSSTVPIKSICFQSGFTGMAHFSKWFRRQTGYSPQQYREHYLP